MIQPDVNSLMIIDVSFLLMMTCRESMGSKVSENQSHAELSNFAKSISSLQSKWYIIYRR